MPPRRIRSRAQRPKLRGAPAFLRLAVLALGMLAATGRPTVGGAPDVDAPPEENVSYVRDDARLLRESRAGAEDAAARQDWGAFVRAWQAVVDALEDDEGAGAADATNAPRAAAPYVVAVRGTTTYEGAWRVAHHRILEAGPPARAAYDREYGTVAEALLARGVVERRPDLLEATARRFLIHEAGRRSAILLADLALEAGDEDGALTWLQRLEDLEEVAPDLAGDGWQEGRVRRRLVAEVRPEHWEEARALLTNEVRAGETRAWHDLSLPPSWTRPPPDRRAWPTSGGAACRAAVPASAGRDLTPAWFASFEVSEPEELPPGAVSTERPSPWLPPRAVSDGDWAYVSDGRQLAVFAARSGRRACQPATIEDAYESSLWVEDDETNRDRLGLLEGHALTLGDRTPEGQWIYLAAPEPAAYSAHWSYGEVRDDRVEAWLFDGQALRRQWRAGGRSSRPGLPVGTRLYGAPLLYRGRVWVAGVRPTRGSEDQAEAWLFGLDPGTGNVQVRTWLCAGPPPRKGRADEAIPSSPAGARGRVVVVTGLGVVAAVDAFDGRVHWLLRHERGVVAGGRLRRLVGAADTSPRQSSFDNEPPLLALDRVYAAPTDGPKVLVLFDRPRGPARALVSWRLDRRHDFRNFAVEQIAGVASDEGGGPSQLILVGRGVAPEGAEPPPLVVAVDAVRPTRGELWRGVATTGHGAEVYGRALVTDSEVMVPTRWGLVRYGLPTGDDLPPLDTERVPAAWRADLPDRAPPFGNLVPVPGLGLLAVNDVYVTLWRAP